MLGTERHESRRIDNQLRGRTGRQGDPGKSKFYICLEDDLLRIFAAERLDAIMRGLGIQEDEAIIHPWMNKALETSQKRVEQRNFEIRKNLLKFDDVINDQRKAIFEQRIEFMRAADVAPIRSSDMRHERGREAVSGATCRRRPIPTSGTSPTSRKRSARFSACTSPCREWAPKKASRSRKSSNA